MRFALILTALAGSVAALSITSPKKDQDVDLSQKTDVEWTSVSTDPSSFDMYLVKMNTYPSVNQLLAKDVKTSAGSYTLSGVSAANGDGYQINFISNDPQNTGILAQSQQFNVTSSGSSTTSASTSSATETTTSSSASSTGKASTTSSSASSSTSTMTTSASGTASTSTNASTTTKGSSNSTASSTSAPSTTLSSGAGALAIPASALLLGLAVLAL